MTVLVQILDLFTGLIKSLVSSQVGPGVCKAVTQMAETKIPPLLKNLDAGVAKYLQPPQADAEPALPGDPSTTALTQ